MSQLFCFSHFRGDPFYNMAFDDAMIDMARSVPDSVWIRLYTWQPGAITIGVHQTADLALDWSAIGSTPVIRRITGGRALFHDESELTYAVAINTSSPSMSRAEATRELGGKIGAGIVEFLTAIGKEAQMLRSNHHFQPVAADRAKPPCFASSARHEIVSDAGKIVASAARVTPDVYFQHGSIKLSGLVSHPSLVMPNGVVQNEAALPVGPELFAGSARPFFRSTSEALGCNGTGSSEVPERGEEDVRRRLAAILQNPLNVRKAD